MTKHTIQCNGGSAVIMPSLAGDVMILAIEPAGEGMTSLTLTRDALSVLLFAIEQVADCMDIRQSQGRDVFSVTHHGDRQGGYAASH